MLSHGLLSTIIRGLHGHKIKIVRKTIDFTDDCRHYVSLVRKKTDFTDNSRFSVPLVRKKTDFTDDSRFSVSLVRKKTDFTDNSRFSVPLVRKKLRFTDDHGFISGSVPQDSGLIRRSLCGSLLPPAFREDSRLSRSSRCAIRHSSGGPGSGMTTMSRRLSGQGRNI